MAIAAGCGTADTPDRAPEPQDTAPESSAVKAETAEVAEATDTAESLPSPGYVVVSLPEGGRIELPEEWAWLDQQTFERMGLTLSEVNLDLSGAALVAGQRKSILRSNSNPQSTYASIAINVTADVWGEEEIRSLTSADAEELGALFLEGLTAQNAGLFEVASFDGLFVETRAGHPAWFVRYVRTSSGDEVAVRNTHVFVDPHEFSFVLAYRVSEADRWEPVIEHILECIQFPDS
jgi:hypothetical protein